jgi:hypothetical protein
MRPIARWIAISMMAGTAHFAAAEDSGITDTARGTAANESNARLLADRHLAFYWSVRLPDTTTTEANAENNGLPAPVVRTSATAAIPLSKPAPEADGQ